MRDEDARRAAQDPNYKPRFKQPETDDGRSDKNYDLKKRLEEERKKHRQEYEEQFEDDLDLDDLYGDDFYGGDSPDPYEDNIDYYYDADGFAHPKKSKDSFGYGRYDDAYKYHYDPYVNEGVTSDDDSNYYDDEDDYYSESDWDYDSEDDDYDRYDRYYHDRHSSKRRSHDDRYSSKKKDSKKRGKSSRYGYRRNSLFH